MRTQEQINLAATMATLFLAAAEALAQDDCEDSRRRIVISIADRKLAVVEAGRVVKVYSTAVGTDATPTPAGVFKIANRITHPTWYGPNHIVVPPGKANPLGTRWMGLTRRGYGIHGTNNPRSIGSKASHGCIRMRRADVEELFEWVRVGDEVELVAAPTQAMTWIFESPAESAVSAE